MTLANALCTIDSDEDILLILAITQIDEFWQDYVGASAICTAAEKASSSQSTHNLWVEYTRSV